MLSGREPDPARPDEVTVSFSAQQRFGINLGDTLHLDMQPAAQGAAAVPVDVKVVGVDAAVAEFTPSSSTDSLLVWTTPAFARVHGAALADEPGTVIWLHHGDGDLARFGAGLARLSNGKLNQAFPFSAQGRQTQRSIHLQAVALWMLARAPRPRRGVGGGPTPGAPARPRRRGVPRAPGRGDDPPAGLGRRHGAHCHPRRGRGCRRRGGRVRGIADLPRRTRRHRGTTPGLRVRPGRDRARRAGDTAGRRAPRCVAGVADRPRVGSNAGGWPVTARRVGCRRSWAGPVPCRSRPRWG